MAIAFSGPISVAWTSLMRFMLALGILPTMPAKMSSETPLPMPISATCSHSHMMRIAPAVSVRTVFAQNQAVGFEMTAMLPGICIFVMAMVRPKDWKAPRSKVR